MKRKTRSFGKSRRERNGSSNKPGTTIFLGVIGNGAAESVAKNATNRRTSSIKMIVEKNNGLEMECDHSDVIWDYERGEMVCRKCGEVLSEIEMVPQIRHNPKLETVFSYVSALKVGTLPPTRKQGTDLKAVRLAEKICNDIALPLYIQKEAAVQVQKILAAARTVHRRVKVSEASAAAVYLACRVAGHPCGEEKIAEVAGMEPNALYRLVSRIHQFYDTTIKPIPPEKYIRVVSADLRKTVRLDPHYVSILEIYAHKIIDNCGALKSKNPLYVAAAAFAAADEKMAREIGIEKVAKIVGAAVNGTLSKLVRTLKNLHVRPPAGAIKYKLGLRRRMRWRR